MNQVMYNMIITKDLYRKVYDYIDPLREQLASLEWSIREAQQQGIGFTTDQDVLGRDMLFKLKSLVYWCVITSGKQQQVGIYNAYKNSILVRYEYTVGNIVYVDKSGI